MDNKEFIQKLDICLKDRVLGIYGQSGSGKTTALKKRIRNSNTKKLNKKL